MPQAEGYIIVTNADGWGKTEEYDSFMCCHCNRIIIVQPGSGKERGYCFNCDDMHCGGEQCWNCRPFEAWLDAMEATHRHTRRLWERISGGMGIKGIYTT